MIPPQILERFGAVPGELIGLCRPHPWGDLSAPPGEGMRSIRDILVHLVAAERGWIQHVVLGQERMSVRPEAFGDLEAIRSLWRPQRNATVALVGTMTPDEWGSTRPLPWDREQSASVGAILWHVVTHEQYHRGQIFTRLALLGRRDLPDNDLLR